MTKHRRVTALTLTDGSVAADGGSISLQALNQDGARVDLYLDWSITSQTDGTAQFFVNGKAIPKRSMEEVTWLDLLRAATARDPGRELSRLAGDLVSAVSSEAYQGSHRQPESSTIGERIRRLLTRSRK